MERIQSLFDFISNRSYDYTFSKILVFNTTFYFTLFLKGLKVLSKFFNELFLFVSFKYFILVLVPTQDGNDVEHPNVHGGEALDIFLI